MCHLWYKFLQNGKVCLKYSSVCLMYVHVCVYVLLFVCACVFVCMCMCYCLYVYVYLCMLCVDLFLGNDLKRRIIHEWNAHDKKRRLLLDDASLCIKVCDNASKVSIPSWNIRDLIYFVDGNKPGMDYCCVLFVRIDSYLLLCVA